MIHVGMEKDTKFLDLLLQVKVIRKYSKRCFHQAGMRKYQFTLLFWTIKIKFAVI